MMRAVRSLKKFERRALTLREIGELAGKRDVPLPRHGARASFAAARWIAIKGVARDTQK